MKHILQEEMSAYIHNRLEQEERAELEEHLYGCEDCLQLYMDRFEEDGAHAGLPMLAEAEAWTDRVMEQLRPPRRRWYHSSLFHYGIAAAIMLVLTASGLFQGVSFGPKERSSSQEVTAEAESSYSEKLMHRTLAVLDQIKEKREAGHE